ncbi:hypothetical protein, partial [Acidaminococcus timonensis]|uniref:hypothetical protein n=1 Tax=Acidaminococcus timonensis TaxID=1871002 RepID=UPI002943CA21
AQCTMGIFPSGVRIEWAEQKEFSINIPPRNVKCLYFSLRHKFFLLNACQKSTCSLKIEAGTFIAYGRKGNL